MPRALIVDDHAMLRRGLRALLETHPGWECCGESASGEEAIRSAAELKPDVIIMDVSMPGMGGIKATQLIQAASPDIRILLFTLHQSTELLRAGVSAGASGYILKSESEDEFIEALETVHRGEIYITRAISPAVAANIVEAIRRSSEAGKPAEIRIAKAQS